MNRRPVVPSWAKWVVDVDEATREMDDYWYYRQMS